jgi:hypothetical protein
VSVTLLNGSTAVSVTVTGVLLRVEVTLSVVVGPGLRTSVSAGAGPHGVTQMSRRLDRTEPGDCALMRFQPGVDHDNV